MAEFFTSDHPILRCRIRTTTPATRRALFRVGVRAAGDRGAVLGVVIAFVGVMSTLALGFAFAVGLVIDGNRVQAAADLVALAGAGGDQEAASMVASANSVVVDQFETDTTGVVVTVSRRSRVASSSAHLVNTSAPDSG